MEMSLPFADNLIDNVSGSLEKMFSSYFFVKRKPKIIVKMKNLVYLGYFISINRSDLYS